MNNKAFYNFDIWLFCWRQKRRKKANACIVNAGVQVRGEPVRVAVSVLNTIYLRAY